MPKKRSKAKKTVARKAKPRKREIKKAKKCKKSKRKAKGHKRISGFSWKNDYGVRQSLSEEDFYSRKEFMAERKRFKKDGVKVRDTHTRSKYRSYEER